METSKAKEKVIEGLPNLTDKQIRIIDFWKIRGYENITHCLGMNISLHKKDKYAHLGIDLQYLEQFYNQAIQKTERNKDKEILEKVRKIRSLMIKEHKGEFSYGNSGYGIAIQSFADRLEKQLKEEKEDV